MLNVKIYVITSIMEIYLRVLGSEIRPEPPIVKAIVAIYYSIFDPDLGVTICQPDFLGYEI